MTVHRWSALVNVFVPFAFLIAIGNLYAETADSLTFARVRASILVSVLFALPATMLFFLFDVRRAPVGAYRYQQLLWTFGFAAYAIHAYYSVGVWFEWDFAQIDRRQTWYVAWTNYVLLFLWGVDVVIGLIFGQQLKSPFLHVLRWVTHLLFVVAFSVAAIVFHNEHKTLTSLLLGWTLVLTAGVTLMVRLVWGDCSNYVFPAEDLGAETREMRAGAGASGES